MTAAADVGQTFNSMESDSEQPPPLPRARKTHNTPTCAITVEQAGGRAEKGVEQYMGQAGRGVGQAEYVVEQTGKHAKQAARQVALAAQDITIDDNTYSTFDEDIVESPTAANLSANTGRLTPYLQATARHLLSVTDTK